MLRLYLLRHGIPEDGPDPKLSEAGTAAMRRAASGMARLGFSFDFILSSPLRRAESTARIVADAAAGNPEVTIEQQLAGGCSAAALLGVLAAHRAGGNVLVVGHQPDMGRIAAELAGCEDQLPFGRGTLCCLELAKLEPGAATLVFHIPAELLERAG